MLLEDASLVLAVVVAVGALLFAALLARRAVLFRRGAIVACAFRPLPDGRWHGGMARFDPDALRAFRGIDLSLRPALTLDRQGLRLGEQRAASDAERARLMAEARVVHAEAGQQPYELALGATAMLGLHAWVEGRPVAGEPGPL